MVLSNCEKFGYGCGHLLNDLCSAFWFTYSLICYDAVLGLSRVHAGAIMLIGQVADALATPVIGVLTDRTSLFVEYGRLKSWHISGTVGVFLTFPFMYSPCLLCENAEDWKKLIYYSFYVVLFQFAWAAVQIAHLALVPVLSDDSVERTFLFSLRNSFTFLASILTYIIAWLVLGMKKGGTERVRRHDVFKFQAIDFTICVIGAVSTFIFQVAVNEKVINTPRTSSSDVIELVKRLNFKELFSQCLLYQAALIYTSARTFCNVSQSFINLYLLQDLFLNKESIARIPFIIFVSSFLTSWITTPMNKSLGRKLSFVVGCLIGLAACLMIQFCDGYIYKTYWIYLLAFLLGSSYSVQMVTSLAVTADLIGQDKGNSAFVFGALSCCEKMANGLVIMLIQSIAPVKSYHSEPCTFYRNAIFVSCGSSALIGLISILTIRTQTHRN